MSDTTTIILIGIVAFGASWLGANFALNRRKFIIKVDEKGDKIELTTEPMLAKLQQVVYIPDANQEELEEMAKEPRLKRFLKSFAKPAEKEDE